MWRPAQLGAGVGGGDEEGEVGVLPFLLGGVRAALGGGGWGAGCVRAGGGGGAGWVYAGGGGGG